MIIIIIIHIKNDLSTVFDKIFKIFFHAQLPCKYFRNNVLLNIMYFITVFLEKNGETEHCRIKIRLIDTAFYLKAKTAEKV